MKRNIQGTILSDPFKKRDKNSLHYFKDEKEYWEQEIKENAKRFEEDQMQLRQKGLNEKKKYNEDLAHFVNNKDRRTKEQIHYEKERDQRLIHENVETYNESEKQEQERRLKSKAILRFCYEDQINNNQAMTDYMKKSTQKAHKEALHGVSVELEREKERKAAFYEKWKNERRSDYETNMERKNREKKIERENDKKTAQFYSENYAQDEINRMNLFRNKMDQKHNIINNRMEKFAAPFEDKRIQIQLERQRIQEQEKLKKEEEDFQDLEKARLQKRNLELMANTNLSLLNLKYDERNQWKKDYVSKRSEDLEEEMEMRKGEEMKKHQEKERMLEYRRNLDEQMKLKEARLSAGFYNPKDYFSSLPHSYTRNKSTSVSNQPESFSNLGRTGKAIIQSQPSQQQISNFNIRKPVLSENSSAHYIKPLSPSYSQKKGKPLGIHHPLNSSNTSSPHHASDSIFLLQKNRCAEVNIKKPKVPNFMTNFNPITGEYSKGAYNPYLDVHAMSLKHEVQKRATSGAPREKPIQTKIY